MSIQHPEQRPGVGEAEGLKKHEAIRRDALVTLEALKTLLVPAQHIVISFRDADSLDEETLNKQVVEGVVFDSISAEDLDTPGPRQISRLFVFKEGLEENSPITVIWNGFTPVEDEGRKSNWFNGFVAHYFPSGFVRVFETDFSQHLLDHEQPDVTNTPLL